MFRSWTGKNPNNIYLIALCVCVHSSTMKKGRRSGKCIFISIPQFHLQYAWCTRRALAFGVFIFEQPTRNCSLLIVSNTSEWRCSQCNYKAFKVFCFYLFFFFFLVFVLVKCQTVLEANRLMYRRCCFTDFTSLILHLRMEC